MTLSKTLERSPPSGVDTSETFGRAPASVRRGLRNAVEGPIHWHRSVPKAPVDRYAHQCGTQPKAYEPPVKIVPSDSAFAHLAQTQDRVGGARTNSMASGPAHFWHISCTRMRGEYASFMLLHKTCIFPAHFFLAYF